MKTLQIICVFLISLVSNISSATPLSISETEINQYLTTRLAEKVPLQDKVGIPGLFQLDYKLHNLFTRIGQTSEKNVEISGIIDGQVNIKGNKHNATIQLNLTTEPYYDAEQGAVYLKNIQLKNWQVNPDKYQNELQMFLPLLADGIAGILNHNPVYTLDESKMKEALVKKFGKAIIVEKGQIRLETAIF